MTFKQMINALEGAGLVPAPLSDVAAGFGCPECGSPSFASMEGSRGFVAGCLACAWTFKTEQPSADPLQAIVSASVDHDGRRLGEWIHIDRAVQYARENPPEWIVEGFLMRRGVTLLVGRPGVGKSYLALCLAAAISSGGKFAGRPVDRPGRVAWVDAEMGALEVAGRIGSAGLTGGDMGLMVVNGFSLIKHRDIVIREVVARKPDLIVADSLRRLTTGADENDSGEMSVALETLSIIARECNAAVLGLHHQGKNADADFRGSSAIEAQVDALLVMTRTREEQGIRSVKWAKIRNAPEPDSDLHLTFSLVDIDGLRVPSFTPTDHVVAPALGDMESKVLEVLADGGWHRLVRIAEGVGVKSNHNTLSRALEHLMWRKDIVKSNAGYKLAGVDGVSS